ncbi:MAG: hypothetical protein ACO3FR_06475 [Ilumatobacteraceae bacterium]
MSTGSIHPSMGAPRVAGKEGFSVVESVPESFAGSVDVDPVVGPSPTGVDVFVRASPPHVAMNSTPSNGNHRYFMSARVG